LGFVLIVLYNRNTIDHNNNNTNCHFVSFVSGFIISTYIISVKYILSCYK